MPDQREFCEACKAVHDPRVFCPGKDPQQAPGGYEFVDHPEHYNQHPAGIECIDVIEHLSFNVGTAIKHCWRAGLKPGAGHVQDLRKAIWYLTREVSRLEASR